MEADIDRRRLGSYLNDHLAGSVAGIRVARRIAAENEGNEYGPPIQRMVRELEEEQKVLRHVLHQLNIAESPLTKLAGWAAERAEEWKTRVGSQGSPSMKRLMDLEALLMGATGNRCLWQTLELAAVTEPTLAEFDFASLQERAGRRVSRLGQLRLEARLPAFAGKHRGAIEATPSPAEPARESPGNGSERRSGRDRRVHHFPTPASLERRAGGDRRAAQLH